MNIQISSSGSGRGFTLPEILIALTIFLLVLAGIVSANIFGLRMVQVNQTKLNATEWSRRTFGKLTDEVRSCNAVSIGNMTTNNVFEGLLSTDVQQGNAIQIQPTTNTTTYLVYYFQDPLDNTFRREEETPNSTNVFILADSVTNTIIFNASNLFTETNSRMIHLTLEFFQPETFMLGPNNYKLETSVTRRILQ